MTFTPTSLNLSCGGWLSERPAFAIAEVSQEVGAIHIAPNGIVHNLRGGFHGHREVSALSLEAAMRNIQALKFPRCNRSL